MIKILPAVPSQASEIARLIMEAMDYDCCRYFAGTHSLDEFHRMMTTLVGHPASPYSYRNTLVAVQGRDLAGILTSYDGKDFHRLRQVFIDAERQWFGIDLSEMEDETQAGEYYLDSLCVKEKYRKHGIASSLIREAIRQHGDQPVGLLVDHTHPWAERLYKRLGFRFVNETEWGGHAMNHLQYPVRCREFAADPFYLPYHDEEWGTPVHDDRDHFMYLLMESMSCGLSWKLMLQKREVFRRCFAGFDAAQVAAFTDEDIRRILDTPGMIRSERKVRAMIHNARMFLKVQEEWGTFDRYIWHFTEGKSLIYPSHRHHWVTRNALSDTVAADLRKRGFQYVGSVIIYSHLQAIGIINDHRDYCYRYRELMGTDNTRVVEEE